MHAPHPLCEKPMSPSNSYRPGHSLSSHKASRRYVTLLPACLNMVVLLFCLSRPIPCVLEALHAGLLRVAKLVPDYC